MSPAELVDDAVEEVLEDDAIEEVEDDASSEKVPSKRKTFSTDNVYLHKDAASANAARDNFKYTDGTKVEGFRVFGFNLFSSEEIDKEDETRDNPLLQRGEDRKLKNCTDYVVARTTDLAASYLMEGLGWRGGLWKTKSRTGGAGRGKSTVSKSMLEYGKMLAVMAFGLDAPEGDHNQLVNTTNDATVVLQAQADTFKKYYGPGAPYDHYRDELGNWKEWNKDA